MKCLIRRDRLPTVDQWNDANASEIPQGFRAKMSDVFHRTTGKRGTPARRDAEYSRTKSGEGRESGGSRRAERFG